MDIASNVLLMTTTHEEQAPTNDDRFQIGPTTSIGNKFAARG